MLAAERRERRPGLKVLFVTGYADTILSGKGLLGTGMAVVAKPFAISELAATIRTMVGSDPVQEAG